MASRQIADVGAVDKIFAIERKRCRLNLAVAGRQQPRLTSLSGYRVEVSPTIALPGESYVIVIRPEQLAWAGTGVRRVLVEVVVSGPDAGLGAPNLVNLMAGEARRQNRPGFASSVLARVSGLRVRLAS